MEPSFDLDINNYTTEDLLNFFKLDDNYSLEDLIEKEVKLATEILSVNNKKYNPKYKFDIINFIKLAKDVLISFKNEMKEKDEIKKSINKMSNFLQKDDDPRVGRIINPLSSHPALETDIIPKHSINGYAYDITTSVYVFNSGGRNSFFDSKAVSSIFDLPVKWKNVISISLASVTIPNVMYAFNKDDGTNQIYIEEDNTGISGIVTLPEGNYSPYAFQGNIFAAIQEASFPESLTKAINDQLGTYSGVPPVGRFKVTIDLSNHITTITNNTHTFSMYTLNKDPNIICNTRETRFNIDYTVNPPKREDIPLLVYTETLGYLMGYREVKYYGKQSYPSESIFQNIYANYLYFALDDYTGAQPVTNTYGILGPLGILEGNILGIIPINSTIFTPTFDNNANFIYKKREYFGPVDISKISVRLLNQRGNLINLRGAQFNFSLQVKTIYNLSGKTKINMRGSGFL